MVWRNIYRGFKSHFGPRLWPFSTLERPQDVTNAMMWFFHSMLGAGLPIFDRSRHYGLPTKPVGVVENWGVNPGMKTRTLLHNATSLLIIFLN